MYRPASSATGTAPTVRFVFSRPVTFGMPMLEPLSPGLPHPAASSTEITAAVALIARRNVGLIFLLALKQLMRRRDARYEPIWDSRGRTRPDTGFTCVRDDSDLTVARERNCHICRLWDSNVIVFLDRTS